MKEYSNIVDVVVCIERTSRLMAYLALVPEAREDFGPWVNEFDWDNKALAEKVEAALTSLEDVINEIEKIGVKAGVSFD